MKTTSIAAIAACALLAGCQQVPQPETTTDAAGNTLVEWPLPAGAGAAQPDMSLAPDGRLLLSWIKPFDRTRHELQYTTFDTAEIGRAHVCTPVTNAHLVCRLLVEK